MTYLYNLFILKSIITGKMFKEALLFGLPITCILTCLLKSDTSFHKRGLGQ